MTENPAVYWKPKFKGWSCGNSNETRGTDKNLGSNISLAECINRCDAATPLVCNTFAFGENGSCTAFTGKCEKGDIATKQDVYEMANNYTLKWSNAHCGWHSGAGHYTDFTEHLNYETWEECFAACDEAGKEHCNEFNIGTYTSKKTHKVTYWCYAVSGTCKYDT